MNTRLITRFLATALIAAPLLPAPLAAQETASLELRILSHETREPIPGALVKLHEAGRSAITDPDGYVRIHGLTPGKHTVTVSMLGYGEERMVIGFGAGATVTGTVELLTQAMIHKTLEVIAKRNDPRLARSGFFERRKKGIGHFLHGEELERRAKSAVTIKDLFHGVPGFAVKMLPGRARHVLVSTRGSVSLLNPCSPPIIWNGFPLSLENAMLHINPNDIVGMEFYPSTHSAPAEWRSYSPCGVVLVWTR